MISPVAPHSRAIAAGSAVAALGVLGVVLGAAAVVNPPIALAVVLGAIFIALASRNLAAGVTAFIVLIFFERLPGLPASQITAVKAAGLILVLAWLGHVAANRGSMPLLTRESPVVAYAAAALVGVALVSTLWAVNDELARSSALRLAQGPLLLLVVVSALRTPQHLRWMLGAYLAGAVATAVVGFGQTSADSADVGRLSGGIQDPNELAAALLPAVPIALFGMAVVTRRLVRVSLVAALLVLAASLFMTGSRGGLVGLGVMFVAAIFLSGPLRQQVVLGMLVVTAVAVIYYTLLAPPEVLWRLTHFSAEGGSGRTDLWSVALQMYHDHPFLGVASDNFEVVEPSYTFSSINLSTLGILDETKVVHNTYLHVLVELGVIGLVLFAIVILGAFVGGLGALRALRRSEDRKTEILARGLLIGFTGMLASYTFISGQYEKELWLLTGVAIGLRTLARGQAAEGALLDRGWTSSLLPLGPAESTARQLGPTFGTGGAVER